MRPVPRAVACLFGVLAVPLAAAAQSAVTYRAEVTAEATATRVNSSSPLVPAGTRDWIRSPLFVATGSGSWEPGPRLKLAGGLALTGSSGDRKSTRLNSSHQI